MNSNSFYISKRNSFGVITLIVFYGLLLLTSISLFGCGGNDNADLAKPEEEAPQTFDPAIIAGLDADYFIDYENGTIPIGDLPIGARVVDPGWKWQYKQGVNYSDIDQDGDHTPAGEVKPVTWIVVAKDQYDGLEAHVTLLSEDLIGLRIFDNSTGRSYRYNEYGYNHWGDSGTKNATHGLRPWLNSTGVHTGEGFYQAFSDVFKRAVLTTTVPNGEWEKGTAYSTQDNVFVPSSTELGDTGHIQTYRIGNVYPYFSGASNAKRVSLLGGEAKWYWTRSPDSRYGNSVRAVHSTGDFYYYYYDNARNDYGGVRPALNLKAETLVSEIRK